MLRISVAAAALVVLSASAYAQAPCTRGDIRAMASGQDPDLTKCQQALDMESLGQLTATVNFLRAQVALDQGDIAKFQARQAELDKYLAACGDKPGCTQPIVPDAK